MWERAVRQSQGGVEFRGNPPPYPVDKVMRETVYLPGKCSILVAYMKMIHSDAFLCTVFDRKWLNRYTTNVYIRSGHMYVFKNRIFGFWVNPANLVWWLSICWIFLMIRKSGEDIYIAVSSSKNLPRGHGDWYYVTQHRSTCRESIDTLAARWLTV